jgi:hypothetical protein
LEDSHDEESGGRFPVLKQTKQSAYSTFSKNQKPAKNNPFIDTDPELLTQISKNMKNPKNL